MLADQDRMVVRLRGARTPDSEGRGGERTRFEIPVDGRLDSATAEQISVAAAAGQTVEAAAWVPGWLEIHPGDVILAADPDHHLAGEWRIVTVVRARPPQPTRCLCQRLEHADVHGNDLRWA